MAGKRGRPKGAKNKPETIARRAAEREREANDYAFPPDEHVPSEPEGLQAANHVRHGLLRDLLFVSGLAQEMCGGIGVGNIEEWQSWVRKVVTEAMHHVRRSAL